MIYEHPDGKHGASYKDPSGFVFWKEGRIIRQVNYSYAEEYEQLINSGLYDQLSERGWLVAHQELDRKEGYDDRAFKVLLPAPIDFISYPYEWSFHMLKDAAITTLDINLASLEKGMILKDASAWNISFLQGSPIFIDTLSFSVYKEDQPWVAYRQFCHHFLYPLLGASYFSPDCIQWLRLYREGFSTSLTAKLVPLWAKCRLGIFLHLQLPLWAESRPGKPLAKSSFSYQKMKQLLQHLKSTVQSLQPAAIKTTWDDYYDRSILSQNYLYEKEAALQSLLGQCQVANAVDLGCNNGYFSKMLLKRNITVIATDFDPMAIDQLYLYLNKEKKAGISPLITNLTNPGPSLGWMNGEDTALLSRLSGDLCLALALVHHLYFTYNVPFDAVIALTDRICLKYCIIEFVELADEKTKLVSRGKELLLPGYTRELFEASCKVYFTIIKTISLESGKRQLYLLGK